MQHFIRRTAGLLLLNLIVGHTAIIVAAETPITTNGINKIKILAEAMGGLDKINQIHSQQIIAAGDRFEPEQAYTPGGDFIHIADYQITLTKNLEAQQFVTDWQIDAFYPLLVLRQYTEVINGNQGAVLGVDTIIAPLQAPMLSTRLGARTKQYLMTSPLSLVKRALASGDNVGYLGLRQFDRRPHYVIAIPGWDQPILLFIDTKTRLLSKAETLEDDSIYGDAKLEVLFSHWSQVEDISLPMTVTLKFNGREIGHEQRQFIGLNVTLNEDTFNIAPDLKLPFDAQQFAWGIRSSQFFNRFLPAGIPFDLDQTKPETVNIVEIAPQVFHIRAFTHHSLLVEMDSYLVIVDPVLYADRTQVILEAINKQWPNKPVKYVIASHFHNDHIGGIRGYAAIGATLIVGEGTESHYEKILAAPHSIYPDAYAQNPRKVKIISVDDDEPYVLSDGHRNIRIMDIPNRHAIGMLVPYIEDANLIFVSDLYNPELFPAPIPALFSYWSFDLLDGLEKTHLDIHLLAGAHGGVTTYAQFVADVQASK